ncbi:MAG TPA: ATP-binding cassette domain-containing protein [Phycisphaerae bacterium]|nr:ATP-binding cassette domain-containing protein [Phycisphaerae bacterium]
MAEVHLEGVTKIYPGDVRAVDNISLQIHDREFVVLVGPSGCGKSTTLRMIAGLEDITAGTIRIGDRVVNGVAPKDRDIAMVFQNYALYPHMTVYKNMAFGLLLRRKYAAFDNPLGFLVAHPYWKQARQERQEIDRRVQEAASILGIQELLNRRPRALSGGQRQRVAVGRAIVRQPKAFLFDEPLSNLDAKLRIGMRAELKRLHRQVQTTTVYVTHDQEEAMTLGDRVVVMKDGLIHQCATPYDVYEHPTNRFVAGFIGMPPMNFFEGKLVREGDRLLFDEGDNRLAVHATHRDRLLPLVGQPLTLGVRPEALSPAGPSADAVLITQVSVVEPLGDRTDVYCSTPRHAHIVCRVDTRTRVNENAPARMAVDMARAHYFEAGENGRNVTLAGSAA